MVAIRPRSLVKCHRRFAIMKRASLSAAMFPCLLLLCGYATAAAPPVPPSWEVLPIPRHVDYHAPDDFVSLGKVAVVRKAGSPYETIRDAAAELVGDSTITEEELLAVLKESGVASVECLPDDLPSYDGFDSLILLGAPMHNAVTARCFDAMGLNFDRWDDPNTPEDDFAEWRDFGAEGYLLKVGRVGEQGVTILAGYDHDDAKGKFHGAGTFYALQSFRQLIVRDGGATRVKTAEIADKPLLAVRGCMSGFDPKEEQEWRNVAFMPQIKANQNVYWYGNALAGYNAEAAAKFRYPWRPDQLDCFKRVGKYCRERFVTMVFCMNPDHYGVAWATPKTFDGSERDPLHYDPGHTVEPEFKEMWGALGYEVENDIDILAAKFGQLHKAVPGAILQMMNEDDGFGLVHEADKALFKTNTGDAKQDAINYGRARAELLAALHKRIREWYPDSADVIPLCPPGQLAYQHVLDRDEYHARDFMEAMGSRLKEMGLAEAFPIITTGGGTAAEVITTKTIADFRGWSAGCPVLLHDNNFSHGFHVGAYETDPAGPRSPHQINEALPAGFRDKDLYKDLWGIVWNGLNDLHVLGWCQSQFMWNMQALDREKVNALATRKVSSEAAYPLVKSYYEEFDSPACYLPDCQPPYRLKTVSDRIVFPCEGWVYTIAYTDDVRKECQRLRGKLATVVPQLEAQWDNPYERDTALAAYAAYADTFAAVYLANGYIRGWDDASPEETLQGDALRDLLLDADDIQERFFVGPEEVPGKSAVTHHFYTGSLRYIYTNGAFTPAPKSPAEADYLVDIWKEGLEADYFESIAQWRPGDLPDDAPCLANGWGPSEEGDDGTFRTVSGDAVFDVGVLEGQHFLVRARLGTRATALTASTPITLTAGAAAHTDAVCKPRWLNWLLPEGAHPTSIAIHTEGPVEVYEVGVYRERR
jgi:hypothetical protein